jgi:RND family efflux transporter MFP subunit
VNLSRTSSVVLGIAAILVAIGVLLFWTSPAAQTRREVERKRAQVEARDPASAVEPGSRATVTVDGWRTRLADARLAVEVAGELAAVRRAALGVEVAGRVLAVLVEDNAQVQEGQVLVQLDRELYDAAVGRARAALASARARARLARAELERRVELEGRGIASQADLERAQSEAATTEAAVAEARAALSEAEARLAKTEIRAPFPGVVGIVELDPGVYLHTGDAIAELADLSVLEMVVGVAEDEILALREGQPVAVVLDALPGREFAGRVQRPGRSPDAKTRKYPVPVRLPNAEGQLLPGMLGRVRFEVGESRPVLRVPRRAVQHEFDLDYVFVLASASDDISGTAERRRVATRPVPFHPEWIEVTSGLDPDEVVVTNGAAELRDGMRVRVREIAEPAGLASSGSDPAS